MARSADHRRGSPQVRRWLHRCQAPEGDGRPEHRHQGPDRSQRQVHSDGSHRPPERLDLALDERPGRQGRRQRGVPLGPSVQVRLVRRHTAAVAIGLAIVAAAALIGVTGSDYAVYIVNIGLLAAVGAIALNLLTGYAGQVSIGNAAFLGLGAWTAVIAGSHAGFLAAAALGGLVAAAAGFAVGIPSLRLRGLYLSLTTLALQFVVSFGMNKYQQYMKAPAGFRLPAASLGGWTLGSDHAWYVLLLAFLGLTVLVSWWLVNGKPGRAWVAIREHDVAAALVGVDVTRYKLLAFITSSAFI